MSWEVCPRNRVKTHNRHLAPTHKRHSLGSQDPKNGDFCHPSWPRRIPNTRCPWKGSSKTAKQTKPQRTQRKSDPDLRAGPLRERLRGLCPDRCLAPAQASARRRGTKPCWPTRTPSGWCPSPSAPSASCTTAWRCGRGAAGKRGGFSAVSTLGAPRWLLEGSRGGGARATSPHARRNSGVAFSRPNLQHFL